MDCSFSETQFMFGFLHELLNKHWSTKQGWSPPMFPTQRKERDLGYDVYIQGPVLALFFQFKVPKKINNRNSKFWLSHYNPYYVFKIWPDNLTHQHNNLMSLANSNKCNKVFYCSPGFNTDPEFDNYYRSGVIAKNSIYVPLDSPGVFPIHGADKHYISYTLKPIRNFYMHSDEFRIVGLDYQGFENDINESERYDNVGNCLENILRVIDMGDASGNIYQKLNRIRESDNYEGIKDVYNSISEYLMIRENTCFIILGEDRFDN